jgi:hypothetical protein
MPVEAWRQVQTPPPQQMERRPSFEGQPPNVGRLLVFVLLGVVVGAVAFYWVGLDRLWSLLLGVVVLIILWGIDLAFTTGFTHKLIEQRTEQQRISAALVDAAAVNAAQDELFELINAELKRLDMRIDSVDTFKVHAQGKSWDVLKQDNVDIRIKTWITEKIFNSAGQLVGAYDNGQIKQAVPFKDSAPDDSEELQAYERLVRAGLLSKRGNNYIWIGPLTLTDTFKKLEAMR